MYLYTYTHTYSTPKNIQTPIKGIVAVTKHTVLFHSLGWGLLGLDLHEYATPQSCGACTGDTVRHPRPLLGTAEEGRRKGKGSEAGHQLKPPGERVTCICYFFLKNEVEKILEIL